MIVTKLMYRIRHGVEVLASSTFEQTFVSVAQRLRTSNCRNWPSSISPEEAIVTFDFQLILP